MTGEDVHGFGRMGGGTSAEILCADVLDAAAINYSRATVVFLCLVPRGLKLIKDIVWPVGERLEGEREPGQQRESGGLFYESQSSDAKAALV